ncbi:hypothetical protein HOO65_060296 [Ceratocystis lukuohia]|uniref:Phosphatidate phosphatase APP1 catalytic domain-containing protein n=1 Tax=Ceratocystis lukuohia TaxID=2019550 RepID=A0ABR4MDW2_9PEZI
MSWTSFATGSSSDLNGSAQRSSRRQKLAAMAGNVYRAGATAVDGIRETYAQSRGAWAYDVTNMEPMSTVFPECGIVSQGDDSILIFPTYAKPHSRPKIPRRYTAEGDGLSDSGVRDDEAWIAEWERTADKNAICDVDVRGWLYSPQRPPLTKRMRLMVALARSMSGIPVARQDQSLTSDEAAMEAEAMAEIDRFGAGSMTSKSSSTTSLGPSLARRTTASTTGSSSMEMTAEEIEIANDILMKRISPFLTSPIYQTPVSVFFYDGKNSQSQTFYTDDSGHFRGRVALRFVPTNMRILANVDMNNSGLSKTIQVKMTQAHGISVISDIDDTIKYSNVTGGPREILRNTFVRDLNTLSIDGVSQWYNAMAALGVSFHYCSNSPWQVWPLLATFFHISNLPHGSMHLKQYNGMLQGMWESAADRKRPSLERLLLDFPQRRFLLIGDSGEADLELYTDLALLYPENIIGIFIRDITTPETQKAAVSRISQAANGPREQPKLVSPPPTRLGAASDTSLKKEILPPPISASVKSTASQASTPAPPQLPIRPNWDQREFNPALKKHSSQASLSVQQTLDPPHPGLPKKTQIKPKPPRPVKPVNLQAKVADPLTGSPNATSLLGSAPTTLLPVAQNKSPSAGLRTATHTPYKSNSEIDLRSCASNGQKKNGLPRDLVQLPPPPPPPRRRTAQSILPPPAPAASMGTAAESRSKSNIAASTASAANTATQTSNAIHEKSMNHHHHHHPHLTPALAPVAAMSSAAAAASPEAQTPAAVQRKIEVWQARLKDAHWKLDGIRVPLYTWRDGHEVEETAMKIIKSYNP